MIDIELNLWLERFSRDIGYKSSVIVFGNTSDIMLNPKNSGKFDSVINTIISYIRDRGYKQIIKWDRVDGIDYSISDDLIDVSNQFVQSESPNDYDLGDYDLADNSNQNGNHYKAPDEFFPYMLNTYLYHIQKKLLYLLL